MNTAYTPIHIIIADDHKIFRHGFSSMLKKNTEIKIVGEAENGKELIELTRKLHPDVIITDIRMPVIDGIHATREIKKDFPEIEIIALSIADDEQMIADMISAGARGYLLKNSDTDEIIAAVKSVYKGKPYYCRYTTGKLADMISHSKFNPNNPSHKIEFSDKEVAIIKLICEEYSNKQIADKLHLSKRSVEGCRDRLLKKINAKNIAGIVMFAIRNNICSYSK